VRQVPLLSHQDVFAKVFGVGLPAAVFIDAAVVRMVLVPATMELLSDRNWWLPGWLGRLLPSLHIEGHDVPDDDTAAPEPRRRGPGCPWVPGDHPRGRNQEQGTSSRSWYSLGPHWPPGVPDPRCGTC
jgi:hypothetical protein